MKHRRRKFVSLIPKNARIVEVGVHLGDFSERLIEDCAPRELHLIDPWKIVEKPEYEKALYGGDTSQAEMDSRYQRVIERFREQIGAGQVKVHRAVSAEVEGEIGEVDLVYLDGDHTYDGVRSDLELWWPHLPVGGRIAGDDYALGGWWGDGVVRAIGEWCARPDVLIEWKMRDQIILKKRKMP
ncbi:class I SAM-dependent methyltransferase [Maritimibacter sp. 55A14]|uniref:class I SAM-dependent methyltransferase n=1 Tax=Maritimibacter sp. 55A14 TaxID=2174844 RepID=UPI000D6100F0|nr:class I SAM-dependent methyltransferase [Maritimibacter sp. 55A14]PWE31971.1 class I SAM-dependent methyltransferase [Maritimibacter sp. 55A14]